MAKITITYTAPEAEAEGKVLPISALFEPTGSYVDSPAYEGTVYDTNVPGNGEWEGLAQYMETVSSHPGIVLMFKTAAKEGTLTFDESDPMMIAYYLDLGVALASQGFAVEAVEDTEEPPSQG